MSVPSYLARHQPVAPLDADELRLKARAAWRSRGYACLRVDEIDDPWLKQAVINLATRLYGPRFAPLAGGPAMAKGEPL